MTKIFTIGHSTHQIDDFIAMLRANGIEQLVDVRTIPRSRHNPQYEQTALQKSLPKNGIAYISMKELGGLRLKTKNSINMGWHNESFRNYADYMQTDEFKLGIDKLIERAKAKPTAIMCAEAVPWRCHRSLIADAVLARKGKVADIMNESTTKDHVLTPFAKVQGVDVTYPHDMQGGS